MWALTVGVHKCAGGGLPRLPLLLVICLLASNQGRAASQNILSLQHASLLGGAGNDRVAATAFISSNVVAVGGAFEQSLVLGTNTLQSAGEQDGFVAVLADGQVEWAIRIGGTGLDSVDAVCVGTNGAIFAAGRFTGTLTVAGTQLNATAGSDGFLAAFSRTGEFQWIRQLGGTGDEFFSAMVSNGTNVFVAGSFTQNATLEGQPPFPVSGGQSLLLASFTSTGDFGWARRVSSDQSIQPACVALTSAGDLVVGGRFSGNASFPSGPPVASAGDYDGFLAQYSSSGTYLRRTILSGQGFEEITDVKGLADGRVIATGNFQSGAKLAGQLLPTLPSGVSAGLLALVDTNGNSSVARVLPSITTRALTIGKRGVIHLGGICTNNFSIGPQNFTAPAGVQSVFVVSGTLSGPLLGATIISGDGLPYLFHMDNFEVQIALAGYASGNLKVDGQPISLTPAPAGLNGFVVELSPPSLALKLTLSAPQNALLSWPLYYFDATLEHTDSLVKNPWATVSISSATNANRIEVNSVLSGPKGFYRLRW